MKPSRISKIVRYFRVHWVYSHPAPLQIYLRQDRISRCWSEILLPELWRTLWSDEIPSDLSLGCLRGSRHINANFALSLERLIGTEVLFQVKNCNSSWTYLFHRPRSKIELLWCIRSFKKCRQKLFGRGSCCSWLSYNLSTAKSKNTQKLSCATYLKDFLVAGCAIHRNAKLGVKSALWFNLPLGYCSVA